MLPEEHKSDLITSGIQFLRTITEAYGSEKGMEMWEKISDAIDPDLKGQIFFAMLTGDYEGTIIVTGVQDNMLINSIKEIRAATGWGLKDSKDFVDAVRAGRPGTVPCDPKNRRTIVVNFRSAGMTVK